MRYLVTFFAVLFILNGCSSVVETEQTTQSKASRQTPAEVNSKASNDNSEVSGYFAEAKPATPAVKYK